MTSTTAKPGSCDEEPQVPRRLGSLGLAASAVAAFMVGVWSAWLFTIDDALITFRYSANLADGDGPVWNVTGDPVEGFTNFAWMVWHAPFAALGLDLPTVAKVTSAVFGLATLAMLLRHAGGRTGALVAAGAYLLFLPTYFHITGGLETAAFAAVLLRLAILGVHVLEGRKVRAWEPSLLLLVAGMLRPEGVLAAMPAVAIWIWRDRGRRDAWLFSGAAIVVGITYFLWRWSFYGQLLPNTFYVKFGDIGAGYDWLQVTGAALLPLIILTGSLVLRRSTSSVGLLLCATVSVSYLPAAVSGPWMDYVHRFAYHCYPVLCLGAGIAIVHVSQRWLAAAAAAVTVGWVALAGLTADDLPIIVNYGPDLDRTHGAIGRGLAIAEVPEEARSLAVSDAGAIPYYSGWTTTDYIGLNNEAIAAGEDPNVVVQGADPTVIVVTGDGNRAVTDIYGLRVPQATARYIPVATVKMRDGYSQHVFAKPEWAPAIRASVADSLDSTQRFDIGRYDVTLDRWVDRLLDRLPG